MIRGRDFLDVRKYLYGLSGEASQRTRTGFADYAAFHEALAYAESTHTFHRARSLRDHADIVAIFSTLDSGIALNLENLRKLRNAADYDLDLDSEVVSGQATWATLLTQTIMERLDQLREAQAKAKPAYKRPEDR